MRGACIPRYVSTSALGRCRLALTDEHLESAKHDQCVSFEQRLLLCSAQAYLARNACPQRQIADRTSESFQQRPSQGALPQDQRYLRSSTGATALRQSAYPSGFMCSMSSRNSSGRGLPVASSIGV